MTFFAFLRDSVKEALSGWVLQIMMVIAVLMMLFIGSTSFERVNLKDDLGPKLESQGGLGFLFGGTGQARFRIENFQQTNEGEPWEGNYKFDVVMTCPTKDDLAIAQQKSFVGSVSTPFPSTAPKLKRFIEASEIAGYLKNVNVTEGEMTTLEEAVDLTQEAKPDAEVKKSTQTGPIEVRFLVTSEGTTIENRLAWPHVGKLFFGAIDTGIIMSLREWVYNLQSTLMNDIGAWIFVLIGVVITAGFIPSIMQKGAIDLLISKPVSRFALLMYKYIGGLTFVFLLVSFMAIGTWLVVGLRFDFWSPNFLVTIPILTFYFAVLYAISLFCAVLTRSTIVAILITVMLWGCFTLIGWGNRAYNEAVEQYEELQQRLDNFGIQTKDSEGNPLPTQELIDRAKPSLWTTIPHYLHIFTPRTYDLDKRCTRIIAKGILTDLELEKRGYDKEPRYSWGQTIGVSLVFICIVFGLAYWRFATRDG